MSLFGNLKKDFEHVSCLKEKGCTLGGFFTGMKAEGRKRRKSGTHPLIYISKRQSRELAYVNGMGESACPDDEKNLEIWALINLFSVVPTMRADELFGRLNPLSHGLIVCQENFKFKFLFKRYLNNAKKIRPFILSHFFRISIFFPKCWCRIQIFVFAKNKFLIHRKYS